MPVYEYHCEKCGISFSLKLSMSDHDSKSIICPDCKTDEVVQRYSAFYAKTSKKS